MGNKLLTQTVLIITSITIILTYIKPAFAEISDIQDEIARYNSTVSKAAELNAALQDLVATERSVSAQEVEHLETYLPTKIDDVLVMRDIQNVFKLADIPITGLSSMSSDAFQVPTAKVEGRNERRLDDNTPSPVFKDFQLTFFGNYDELKFIMQGLEVNAYPLEVVKLVFTSTPDPEDSTSNFGLPPGVMEFDLTLRAFALYDSV